MYEVTQNDPVLGSRRWRVEPCKRCEGSGQVWHLGCGDGSVDCRSCEGMGEVARYRYLDKDGVPFGPWRTQETYL